MCWDLILGLSICQTQPKPKPNIQEYWKGSELCESMKLKLLAEQYADCHRENDEKFDKRKYRTNRYYRNLRDQHRNSQNNR